MLYLLSNTMFINSEHSPTINFTNKGLIVDKQVKISRFSKIKSKAYSRIII